jgi:hypothetical protein
MAIPPLALQRIVWVAFPAALYFATQALSELRRGSAWGTAAFAAMAVLVAALPFAAGGRQLSGRGAVGYLALGVPGIVAWLLGPTVAIQVVGFATVVIAQVVAIVMARRSGVEAAPMRDDAIVDIGLSRRVG